MRVLFLRGKLPYPLDNGASIRTYNLLKEACKKHEISLLTFQDSNEDPEKKKLLLEFCTKVILVPRHLKNSWSGTILGLGKNLFQRYPYSVAVSCSRGMIESISSELKNSKYDLVHADTLPISSNLLGLETPPRILNQHNVENVILWRKFSVQTNFIPKKFWHSQWKKMYDFEKKACSSFDRIIAVSIEDQKKMKQMAPEVPVDVVPNGVDIDYFSPKEHTGNKQGLVFTGSLDWYPNEDGILYFLKDILPIILAKVPDINFAIVGKNPSARLARGCKDHKNIILTGWVKDVRPYLHNSSVLVVPLRIGGGTRLKILEALAAGIPIVSTSIGAEGIEIQPGKEILIGDTPDEFASQVMRLMADQELRKKLVMEGKKLVMEKYTWEKAAQSLDQAWNSCLKTTGI